MSLMFSAGSTVSGCIAWVTPAGYKQLPRHKENVTSKIACYTNDIIPIIAASYDHTWA